MRPYDNARVLVSKGLLSWEQCRPFVSLLGEGYAPDYEDHVYRGDLADEIAVAPLLNPATLPSGINTADSAIFEGLLLTRTAVGIAIWSELGASTVSPLIAHHAFTQPIQPFSRPDNYAVLWDAVFGGIFRW
jgi:hypothetical protein